MNQYLETTGDELTVYDLYKDGKGIFQYINDIQPLPFQGLIDVPTVDITFITFYGGRTLSKPISNIVKGEVTAEKLQQIATLIYGMYYSKWSNLFDIYNEKLSLDTYVMTTTENVSDDGETNVNTTYDNSSTNTNTVTGYNSEEWADATKDTNERKDTSVNTGTKTNIKDRTLNVKGSKENRIDDRINAVDTLNREVFNEIIYKDVVRLVGQLIY